jgi:hypothetical protein
MQKADQNQIFQNFYNFSCYFPIDYTQNVKITAIEKGNLMEILLIFDIKRFTKENFNF